MLLFLQLNHNLCLTYSIFISTRQIISSFLFTFHENIIFFFSLSLSFIFRLSKLDLIEILMRLDDNKSDSWAKKEVKPGKEWKRKKICKLALNFLIHPFFFSSAPIKLVAFIFTFTLKLSTPKCETSFHQFWLQFFFSWLLFIQLFIFSSLHQLFLFTFSYQNSLSWKLIYLRKFCWCPT